jgi:hypothetical protein
MKRKSILMTIVAVLFAGMAWGQNGEAWPAAGSFNTLPAGKVVGADTIFFCVRTDSLYPIELGYDVSGRRLHPSYGEWKLISRSSEAIVAYDYELGIPNGNAGAGNAFRTVGTGIGGLIFEYLAKDEQCGLDQGEKFLVYVFILPDFHDVVSPQDTMICYKTPNTSISIDFSSTFATTLDVYAKAGLTATWKNGGTFSVRSDSVASYSFSDTLNISGKPGVYTCGTPVIFNVGARVDSTHNLVGKSYAICDYDTIGDKGQRSPNAIFKRNVANSSYLPAKISPWDATDNSNKYKIYKFTYKPCPTVSNPSPTDVTINDTLYLLDGPKGYWGVDTIIHCRNESSATVFKLFDGTNYGASKPSMDESNSSWNDRDLGQDKSNGRYPYPPYSTTNGKSSLGIEFTGTDRADTIASYDISGYTMNFDIMNSNVAYHYLWKTVGIGCLIDANGVPDSGKMVVILQDPAIAMDYTAQLCKGSYSTAGTFNLNVYTGLGVQWSAVNSPALTNNSILNVQTASLGTFKYKYSIPADCGPGGDGVFYIKVGNKVKVPASKEVKYCISKLPAAINLNDVLGIGVEGLEWTSSESRTAAVGFYYKAGTLDIAKYVGSKGSKAETLTFTIPANAGCGIGGSTLKITFTTSL